MSTSTNQDDYRPGAQPHHPEEPAWRARVPESARYLVLIGCLAAHIELQPDRTAATRRTIHDLYKAVDNLPGGDHQ
ncbi:hypothetical protein [Streptacidiphilus sp. PAMC 29251]